MAFVSERTLLEARNSVKNSLRKPETFTGLILFLYCSKPYKFDGYFKRADMKRFSELADLAFLFNEKEIEYHYSDKEWFALFTLDWLDNVRSSLLSRNKISANDFLISLFWYNPYENIETLINQFKNKIGNDVFDSLFFIENRENPFTEASACNRDTLYQNLNGKDGNFTIRFDNEFIKKRAGDLSAAPFSQTLYAGNDIKRIFTIYDFDISEKLSIQSNKRIEINPINSSTADLSHFQLPKPFLLLAGISGTGKSRFVREQVPEGERKERYQLVAVRPDWHEPSDLLGYVSRLSGQAQYVMTDVLKFIVKAWKAVANAGLLRNNEVAGSKAFLEQVPPYWLCLDEMNLAPVEQYFADYLAVIESRKWVWHNEDEFSYQTEALLSPTAWEDIANFQEQLDVDDALWDFFQTNGIGIPFNLIVAGTVNMDETTHAFSRKVLDRALSFDFSEFYPNDFDAFFAPKTQQKPLSYPIYSQITQNDFDELAFASKSIEFLTALNKQFENTPFKLGYRALNELLLSVKSFQPQTDEELQAVWDDFVMLKVLPRIEGDENKLYSVTQDGRSVLDDIEMVLAKHLSAIWHDNDAVRVDFWQTDVQGKPLKIKCRTKPKLANMKAQLTNRGMVSFW